jgi:hypothetical protein
MEDSPKTDPSKVGDLGAQLAKNAPESGQRAGQGEAPAPDHYKDKDKP